MNDGITRRSTEGRWGRRVAPTAPCRNALRASPGVNGLAPTWIRRVYGCSLRAEAITRRTSKADLLATREAVARAPTHRALLRTDSGGWRSVACPERRTPAISRACSKRLMGFEPSTFCMASRARGADSARTSLQRGGFSAPGAHEGFPEIPGKSRGFGYRMGTEALRLLLPRAAKRRRPGLARTRCERVRTRCPVQGPRRPARRPCRSRGQP